ncbi:hypothetical protein QBC37DRAFT_404364 [Rhypophila decipiens]|uniref:Uncharacterized protein n=1 Tax=Rhypophila decipiens TaxID=261697 RepID=A0AAN7B3Y6_9PEZI|nr:hypothetical protein QBC37DRAFT_404364 [Rhypophila decipiens]
MINFLVAYCTCLYSGVCLCSTQDIVNLDGAGIVEFDVAVLKGRPKGSGAFKRDPKAPRLSNQSTGRQSGLMPCVRRDLSGWERGQCPHRPPSPPPRTINGSAAAMARGGRGGGNTSRGGPANGSNRGNRGNSGRGNGGGRRGGPSGTQEASSTTSSAIEASTASTTVTRVDPVSGGVARPTRNRVLSQRAREALEEGLR